MFSSLVLMSTRLTFILLFIYVVVPSSCYAFSNCIFNASNGKDAYNLSRLSREDVWKTQIPNKGFLHISLCHPIESSPCKNSAYCISKWVDENWYIVISNSGPYQLLSQENGRKFSLELKGTQKCGSTGGNYSIEIYFTCSSYDEDPVLLGSENEGCLLLVMWRTTAACPLIKNCTLGDYDLSSLSVPTYYEIKTNNGSIFELNLCRSVINSSQCHSDDGSPASACEIVEKDNKSKIIGEINRQTLTVIENSGLTLKYTTKKKGPKTLVRFICNPDSKDSTPNFVKMEGKNYYFEVETPLVCSVWPKECLGFNDKGGHFDLKPLRKTEGNWVIQSTTPGIQYYINLCGPLNPIPGYNINTDGGLEACLLNTNNKTVLNLGTVTGGPSVRENVLTLQYTGGSTCPTGGRHEVMIEFSCSNNSGSPVFIETTESCVHHFSWETRVACPTLLDVGKNCKVKELQYGYQYDLSILKSGFEKLKTADNDSFIVNLCGHHEKLCNNKNATVCLQRSGKEIAIGYDNTTIYYESGDLRLESQGEPCEKKFTHSKVEIILLCKHGDDIGSPELRSQMGCDFYFTWYTNAACPTPKAVPCTVEHDGKFYDLSPLTETMKNHIVVQREENLKFSINVCHSVIFGKEAICEYFSGACMMNMSDFNPTTKFTNIGDITSGPYVDTDEKLKLKYDQGRMCHFPNGPDHISTIITFECAQEDSPPVALPGDVCVYEFLWKTKVACPLKEPTESQVPLPTTHDCTVVDPITQKRFDLSKLQNKVYTVSDLDGHNYTFAVCGNLTNSPCGNGSGVCQENVSRKHEYLNAGVGNSRLQYRPHALLLEYKDGSSCNNSKRHTMIEFVCADKASEQIVFIEEQNCSSLISWHTSLVCTSSVYEDCFISGEHSDEINLAPLIRRDSNYVVKADNDTVFFINICRSLLPVQRLSCSEGHSICLARVNDGNFCDEKNIGFYGKLVKKNVGRVGIIYNNGSNSSTTAEIDLECDLKSGIGEPQFHNIMKAANNQSVYHFLWKTNVTCESHVINVSPSKDNCVIHNDQLDQSLNLRELGHRGFIEVTGTSQKYKVDFCGSIHAEQHTTDGSLSSLYGTLSSVTFYYQQRQVSLHFTGSTVCSSTDKSESQLLLNCVPGVESRNPRIFTVSTVLLSLT